LYSFGCLLRFRYGYITTQFVSMKRMLITEKLDEGRMKGNSGKKNIYALP
jgi:hypothetical protein